MERMTCGLVVWQPKALFLMCAVAIIGYLFIFERQTSVGLPHQVVPSYFRPKLSQIYAESAPMRPVTDLLRMLQHGESPVLSSRPMLADIEIITLQQQLHGRTPNASKVMAHLVRNRTQENVDSGRKVILFWTKFGWSKDFGFGFGVEPFKQCFPRLNCETTADKSRAKEAAAVVFVEHSIDTNKLPLPKRAGQKWVMYTHESPAHTRPSTVEKMSSRIDWTMTYRLDSDVYRPLGYWYPWVEDSNRTLARSRTLRGKSRAVSWIVSHCSTPSKREVYAKELKKHIPVDIFGGCPFANQHGNRSCPRSKQQQCMKRIENDYYFYLAFENSFCKDYITEKFWKMMALDVVPVVLGGSLRNNQSDYEKVAPPHGKSYIDTRDFKSPAHLAEYLKYLMSNLTAYEEYFTWKQRARVSIGKSVIIDGHYTWPAPNVTWCTLCEKLHSDDSSTGLHRTGNWLKKFWFDEAKCGGVVYKPTV